MSEPTIICPKCRSEIKLTESLAAPLVEASRRQFEQKLQEELRNQHSRIAAEEAQRANALVEQDLKKQAQELADAKLLLQQRDQKLAEAQKAQADFLKRQRELEDEKRELDVTIEKRLKAEITKIHDQARKEADDANKSKIQELEEQLRSASLKAEDLQRKMQQGSQQLQGEAQELALEALLKEKFRHDIIEPVPKGQHGGDILHRVCDASGNICGTILWECKQRKNWSSAWLAKLRNDRRAAKADICVIATQVLPKDVQAFDFIEDVWVTHFPAAIPVAIALREGLIKLAAARQALQGQETKMALVYQYLTGPMFPQRVAAVYEVFKTMQADLDKERAVITRQWDKRSQQLNLIMKATVGMVGDLQGIAGQAIQELDGLELKALGEGTPSN